MTGDRLVNPAPAFPRPALPPGLNHIDGHWLDDPTAERLPVHDPATEEVIGEIPCSTPALVDRAVLAAQAAFVAPAWRDLPSMARERLLHKLADLIEAHAGELAAIEALDNSKPIAYASTVDVPMSAMWVRYMAGWPSKLGGRCVAPALQAAGTHHAYTLRQPVGVVAAIVGLGARERRGRVRPLPRKQLGGDENRLMVFCPSPPTTPKDIRSILQTRASA